MKQDNRCIDYQKAIKESEPELLWLERHQRYALLRDRMRFLRLLKSGQCGSQAKAGRHIGLGLRGAEKLWKKYRQGGVKGLLRYPYQGSKGKLSKEQQQQLHEELCTDQIQGLQQARQYVDKQFKVHYTTRAMGYIFERLKVKKKTARPTHYHKDVKGEKHFKKKLSQGKEPLWQAHLL